MTIQPVPPPDGVAPVEYPPDAALTRAVVRDALASHLAGKLSPMPVYASRMLTILPGQMPLVLVYARAEQKAVASEGGAPWFTARISVVVQAKLEAEDEAGVEQGLDELNLALEESILRDMAWAPAHWAMGEVSVETRIQMEADRPVGELAMSFDVSVSQENFEPLVPDPLRHISLRVDLIDPFDRLGAYPGQPSAPPRAAGPDGRAEAGAEIELPAP